MWCFSHCSYSRAFILLNERSWQSAGGSPATTFRVLVCATAWNFLVFGFALSADPLNFAERVVFPSDKILRSKSFTNVDTCENV